MANSKPAAATTAKEVPDLEPRQPPSQVFTNPRLGGEDLKEAEHQEGKPDHDAKEDEKSHGDNPP